EALPKRREPLVEEGVEGDAPRLPRSGPELIHNLPNRVERVAARAEHLPDLLQRDDRDERQRVRSVPVAVEPARPPYHRDELRGDLRHPKPDTGELHDHHLDDRYDCGVVGPPRIDQDAVTIEGHG